MEKDNINFVSTCWKVKMRENALYGCAKNAPMRQKIPLKCNFTFSVLSSSPRPQGRGTRTVIMKVVNKEVI